MTHGVGRVGSGVHQLEGLGAVERADPEGVDLVVQSCGMSHTNEEKVVAVGEE